MLLSIIICTYNRDKYIYTTLEKIAHNPFPTDDYEIVLVNNNSTDETAEKCQLFNTSYPEVTFRYFLETQQGLSHARNRGIEEAQGDWLVFLDDDAFVDSTYLQNLYNQLQAHPYAMAFGGKITPAFEDESTPAWLCPWTYSWVSAIDKGGEVILFTKDYPIGANMGFSKECIKQVGLFNTELGRSKRNLIGGEEKDIFNRIKAFSDKIYYFPNVHVQHVIPPQRTTLEFIRKMGKGVGMSEYVRCQSKTSKLLNRYVQECVKWGGTIVISAYYACFGRAIVGKYLFAFRWNVTKGLICPHTNV